jgi:HEAT repeat protein
MKLSAYLSIILLFLSVQSIRAQESVSVLLEQLKEKGTRYAAIESLTKLNAKSGAPEISKLLGDEDFNVRFAALRALVALDTPGYSSEIWKLYESEQDSQIKSYAFAALVFFGDDKAIQSLPQLLTDDIVAGMEILSFIGNLNARAAVPALIAMLEKGKVGENQAVDNSARRAVIAALGRLKADQAIPVLRKYAKSEASFPKWEAIRVLGELESKDAVDELMFALGDALANIDGEFKSDNLQTLNNSARALAAIGDQKSWDLLIKTASHPKFLDGSRIIGELNRHLDPDLWERARKQKVAAAQFKSIKFIVDSIDRENGVELILDFQPGTDFARRAPLENGGGYPWANVRQDSNLLEVVRNLPSAICDGTEPANFTFVFDDGKIRILSVEKAIQWWKTKLKK